MNKKQSRSLFQRLTALALSVLMVLTMLPATAAAAAPTSGTCGANVKWSYSNSTKTLSITGSGAMDDLFTTPWSELTDTIQTVNVGSGVTSLGRSALRGCSAMTKVTLPDTLTSIGDYAFEDCTGLTAITIPASVTFIGNNAFQNAVRLKDVYISDLASYCQIHMYSMLSSPLCSYGRLHCNGKLVENLVIPASVKELGDYAFLGCSSFTSVTIPTTVEKIGFLAFSGCRYIEWADIHDIAHWLRIQRGDCALFENKVDLRAQGRELTHVTIPGSEKTVWAGLSGCTNLESVTFQEGVETIGRGFSDCPRLSEIQIPHSVIDCHDTFVNTAWYRAQNNGILYLGDLLLGYKGENAPSGAVSLRAGTRVLPSSAAADWRDMTSITIPASVEHIGELTFRGDMKLKSVYFTGHAPQFANDYNDQPNAFHLLTTTVYYPQNDPTWNALVGQDLGGTLTWVAYDPADAPHPLSVPTLTVTNNASTGKPYLDWTTVDGADDYEVYYSTSKDGSYTRLYHNPQPGVKHGSAKAGITYYYQVRALAGGVAGEWSTIQTRTCDLPRPDVKASTNSDGKPVLTWKAIPGAESYLIYYRVDGGSFERLTSVHGTTLKHGSAQPGHTYTYKVRALAGKSAANSAWSYYDTVKVDAPVIPVLTVTNTSSTGKPYLKWTAVDGAAKYEVYYSTSKTGTYQRLYTTSHTTLKHGSAKAGTTYYYKVRTLAADGTKGAFSPYKLRTCDLARPDVTVKLRSGHPYLDWQTISGAVKYEVYCSVDGGKLVRIASPSGSRLTHSSAKRGHTYRYRVKAIASKSSANSAYSYYDTITVK